VELRNGDLFNMSQNPRKFYDNFKVSAFQYVRRISMREAVLLLEHIYEIVQRPNDSHGDNGFHTDEEEYLSDSDREQWPVEKFI
jgi:hypothetical protein